MMTNAVNEIHEARDAVREGTNVRGTIIYAGDPLMDCLIKDISLTGMKLFAPRAAWMPSRFTVWTGHNERFEVKKIWARGDFVGVQFVCDDDLDI